MRGVWRVACDAVGRTRVLEGEVELDEEGTVELGEDAPLRPELDHFVGLHDGLLVEHLHRHDLVRGLVADLVHLACTCWCASHAE